MSLTLALVLLAAPPPTGEPAERPVDLSAERVAAELAPYREAHPYAAVTVGVSTPQGRAVYGFGSTTPADAPAAAPDGRTVYELGSITKAFTGLAFARLIEERVVQETDLAADRLPADLAPPTWTDDAGVPRPITLRQLATHTSGLPVQPTGIGLFALVLGDAADPYGAFDRATLAKTLAGMSPQEPGRFAYSNLGVGLLGHALAHADRGDAAAVPGLIAARLTGPLGLRDTAFELTEEQTARFPPPHRPGGETTAPWTFASLGACGGLRSTADDLLTLSDACLGRGPVDLSTTFREASRPRGSAGPETQVGFCWVTTETPAGPLVLHNGGTYGSRSFLGLLPERGIALVVLSNCGASVDGPATRLLRGEEPR